MTAPLIEQLQGMRGEFVGIRGDIEGIRKNVDDSAHEIRRQGRSGFWNRVFIWIGGLSILLDLGLTGYIKVLNDRTNELVSLAATVEQTTYATCLEGNEATAKQIVWWNELFHLGDVRPDATAEEKRQAAELKALFDATFVLKDCGPPP